MPYENLVMPEGAGQLLEWDGQEQKRFLLWPYLCRARVYRSTVLALAPGAWTAIAHDAVAENVGGFTFTNGQLRVPLDGYYAMTWAVAMQNFTSLQLPAALRFGYQVMNADQTIHRTQYCGGFDLNVAGSDVGGLGWSEVVYLRAGQWILVKVYVNTANATAASLFTGNEYTYLQLIRLV